MAPASGSGWFWMVLNGAFWQKAECKLVERQGAKEMTFCNNLLS